MDVMIPHLGRYEYIKILKKIVGEGLKVGGQWACRFKLPAFDI